MHTCMCVLDKAHSITDEFSSWHFCFAQWHSILAINYFKIIISVAAMCNQSINVFIYEITVSIFMINCVRASSQLYMLSNVAAFVTRTYVVWNLRCEEC